jgi:hypothetical protein
MQNLGEQPTGWALNPADAQAVDLLRWSTSGGFLSGGYENDPGARYGTSANLAQNQFQLRCEIPVGIGVLRPQAFCVTFLNPGS